MWYIIICLQDRSGFCHEAGCSIGSHPPDYILSHLRSSQSWGNCFWIFNLGIMLSVFKKFDRRGTGAYECSVTKVKCVVTVASGSGMDVKLNAVQKILIWLDPRLWNTYANEMLELLHESCFLVNREQQQPTGGRAPRSSSWSFAFDTDKSSLRTEGSVR